MTQCCNALCHSGLPGTIRLHGSHNKACTECWDRYRGTVWSIYDKNPSRPSECMLAFLPSLTDPPLQEKREETKP